MKCYLLPIGGTGIRVTRSIVHLCAAGCYKNIDFKIMCIDSDGVNEDKTILLNTLKDYKNLQEKTGNLMPDIQLGGNSGFWSPLEETTKTMDDLVKSNLLSPSAKSIFNFLFTENERSEKLEGGFYGHTSVGSYFASQNVTDKNKKNKFSSVWSNFFTGIDPEKDKIFLVGSIFGGTGASGMPTISRIIKDNPLTKDVPIGAMFVMPYFKPIDLSDEEPKEKLPIDGRTFNIKAKTALSFYINQEFDKIFQCMYFIGENEENFMNVEHSRSGSKQKNKANAIEVYSAASILDFMKLEKDSEFTTKYYVIEVDDKDANTPYIFPETLNRVVKNANVFEKLADFFIFASMDTKYFYYCIDAGVQAAEKGWVKKLEKNCPISREENNFLYSYCKKYVEWMHELLIKTKEDGTVSKDPNAAHNYKMLWLKTSSDYDALYNCKEIPFKSPGFFDRNTKHYIYDELNRFTDVVKGEQNIRRNGSSIADELSALGFKLESNSSHLQIFIINALSLCRKR